MRLVTLYFFVCHKLLTTKTFRLTHDGLDERFNETLVETVDRTIITTLEQKKLLDVLQSRQLGLVSKIKVVIDYQFLFDEFKNG